MAIVKITNPAALPQSDADYQNQNRLLEQLLLRTSTIRGVIDDTVTSGNADFTLKRGGAFEYNGQAHVVDADVVVPFPTTKGESLLYLTYNGSALAFTETAPTDAWDDVKQGYYVSGVKYLGLVVVQWYRRQERIYGNHAGTITLREPRFLDSYVQRRNMPPPNYLYWGKWQNISSLFAGEFERFEGGAALRFGGRSQPDALQDHTHRYDKGGTVGDGPGRYSARSHANIGQNNAETGGIKSSGVADQHIADETRPINRTVRLWMCIDEKS